jgi:hypothetical protein
MPSTLLLDTETWDLTLNAAGDIAVAAEPYAIAQDAASAIKTFSGELFYDTTMGLPYWQQILGHWPPLPLVKAYMVDTALTVPGTASANVFVTSFIDRELHGQVQITGANGVTTAASF